MKREEILAKAQAQKENGLYDEREKLQEIEARKKSAIFAHTCCTLMYILSVIVGNVQLEYLFATAFMNVAYHACRVRYFRKKSEIILVILESILCVTAVVHTIGW